MSRSGARVETAPRGAHGAVVGAPQLAFVVPAFNEERYIAATLASIRRVMADRCSYEIVVVDNGSSDGTVALAREQGARTFVRPAVTVGDLRNFGARQTAAAVLVFVDADVSLTDSWGNALGRTLREFAQRPRLLTGSWCGVPENPGWIEKYWFAPKSAGGNSHINSGHLLIARSFFEQLGGFDARLRTGEDYELSVRALAAQGEMVEDPALAVVHRGYPRTLGAFVRREIWHGRSDFRSLGTVIRSKVALAALFFLFLHLTLLLGITARLTAVAVGAAGAIAFLCLALAVRQYRRNSWKVIAVDTLIYYFYLAGRAIAFVRSQFQRESFVLRDRR